MNSLFRTGVPPATHLTKTGFLQVQVFNTELLQHQLKHMSQIIEHIHPKKGWNVVWWHNC